MSLRHDRDDVRAITGGARLSRVAAPAPALITLAEAKAHLRVDADDDNDLIAALVTTAESWLDGRDGVLGRALLTQTWRLTLDRAPSRGFIGLPLPEVQSIAEITYDDPAGAAQTMPAEDYRLSAVGDVAVIELASAAAWPSLDDRAGALRVTYVAGYGDTAASVPAGLRHAALMLIAQWYEQREAVAIGVSVAEVPLAVRTLIAPYRVVNAIF